MASWPPVIVDSVPGRVPVPWPLVPGARTELWKIDLLGADRPELTEWLESWRPGHGLAARRVAVVSPGPPARRLLVERPGAYLLRSHSPGRRRVALVLASRIRATLALDDDDFEVFCADAYSGEPVHAAFVKVVYRTERLGRERVLTASGTTDANGRWHSSLARDRFAPSVRATALVCRHGHCAVATARRTFDHRDADHHLTMRARSPIAYPGHSTELTGVYRKRRGRRFVAVGNAPIRLRLLGPSGTLVSTLRVRTTAVGAFGGSFRVPKEAAEGSYRVEAAVEDEPGFEPRRVELFAVERLRPEPFYLALDHAPPIVAPGETLALTVTALRPDGKPLAGARVRLVSWGYPVSPKGRPAWAYDAAGVERRRVVALPARLPVVAATDAQGKLAVTWKPTRAELAHTDLLCAVQATVSDPRLGSAERTAEFVLLHEPPGLIVEAAEAIRQPSQPIELAFHSPLAPARRKATEAVCSLSFEDPHGRRRTHDLLTAPVAAFVGRRLVAAASQPGRYTFTARTAKATSAATVWVVGGEGHVAWSGAPEPLLFPERPWCRRGDALRAVIAAPGRTAPVALTLRSGATVRRQLVRLKTGARSVRLTSAPGGDGRLEATLAQTHHGVARLGRAAIELEPGGRTLDIGTRLLWVRHGERPGRGYRVTTRDPLGTAVQSIVRVELVRPAFRGVPPVRVQRRTLLWYPGKATTEQGEIDFDCHTDLLARSYAMFVDALSPEGRAGLRLLRTHNTGRLDDDATVEPLSPGQRLDALARHGLDTPAARWLAACLLARHPQLADRLPPLIEAAASNDEAIAFLRLAVDRPAVAPAALAAALARDGARPAAVEVAADLPAPAWPVGARRLAADGDAAVRLAAARILASALPGSHPSLSQALRADTGPRVRAACAAALGRGDERAVDALLAAAPAESDATVRLAIIEALRRLGNGERTIEAFLTLGLAEDTSVAAAALRALFDVGYRGSDPRLGQVLRAGPSAARDAAARLLAHSGSAEALRTVLAVGRHSPTGPLVHALAPVDSPAVRAAMERWLDHHSPAVRLPAAEYLARRNAPQARAALRRLLDPTLPAELSDRAARALIELRDDPAVPGLLRLVDAGRLAHGTRRALVRAAGQLGWQQVGRVLVAILWQGLAEPARLGRSADRALWLDAVEAVATIGPIWHADVERALRDARPNPLYASALDALRAQGMAAFLRSLWHSPLPADLRRPTVAAYARLRGPSAAPDLVALLQSPVLQGVAARALGDLGATRPLLAALTASSPRTRAGAAAALGAVADPAAVPRLRPLLDDPDPFVRLEAACALAAITGEPVVYTDHLGEPRRARP